MTETIVRPARKFRSFVHTSKLATRAHWNDTAIHFRVRPQPRREIRLDWNDSPTRAFRFCRLHFDMFSRQIDFAPVEALNLRLSQSCESANGEHWDNVRR